MSADTDDPFNGIVFDDDFVNAASRTERSADQRSAEAAWHRRDEQQLRFARGRRRTHKLTRAVIVIAAVVASALLIGFLVFDGPTSGQVAVWERVPTADRPSLTTTTGQRLVDPIPPPTDGESSSFAGFRSDGLPVGYDPCRPVHIAVNPVGGPVNALELVRVVAEQVSAASGLSLIVEGVTDEPASSTRAAYDPDRYGDRWSPVLVAWSGPDIIADLEGDVIGLGGASGMAFEGQEPYAVSGIVYLDAPQLDALPDAETDTFATLLHEFGHAIGLDHVDDPTQIMNAEAIAATTYGAGDLAGLAHVGSIPCAGRL